MVTIVGHWELENSAPLNEAKSWELLLRDFGITRWYMAPISGIKLNEQTITLIEWQTYEEIFNDLDPSIPRWYIEPRTYVTPNTTWLHNLNHPEDIIYVFGSVNVTSAGMARENDLIVSIKTIEDKGVMYAWNAVSIILYDRMIKRWQLP